MVSRLATRAGDARRLPWALQVGVLAVSYLGFAHLGLQLASVHDDVTLVWPPSGLALGALLLFGRRLWPGVFLGVLLLEGLDRSPNALISVGFAVGNTVEAFVGATLLTRLDFRPSLERPRDVGVFLLIAVAGCTLISATIGTLSLLLADAISGDGVGLVLFTWWLGDMGGVLMLTPPLLLLFHGTPSWSALFRRAEYWASIALVIATSAFAILAPAPRGLRGVVLLPCFPVLVWAGARLGSRGAMTASFLILFGATAATVQGVGPLAATGGTGDGVLLWAFAMVIALTAFALAAVVQDRDAADRRYRAEEAERIRGEKERLLLVERERLTREMHDGLGGQLVSLLSMVERGRGTPAEIAEALRRALDDIRIVIDSLDPDAMDLATGLGRLRARLDPLLRRNGIRLEWHMTGVKDLSELAPEAALHVLRIIQESVTNAVRHAGASVVSVRVTRAREDAAHLSVSIRDDGCGLGEDPVRGRGLENLQARARELGAALRVGSAHPGTLVDLELPLAGSGLSPAARSAPGPG